MLLRWNSLTTIQKFMPVMENGEIMSEVLDKAAEPKSDLTL